MSGAFWLMRVFQYGSAYSGSSPQSSLAAAANAAHRRGPREGEDHLAARIRRWWPWRCRGTGAWEGAPTPRWIHSPAMWAAVLGVLMAGVGTTQSSRWSQPVMWLCIRALGRGEWQAPGLWIALALVESNSHFEGALCRGMSAACALSMRGEDSAYEAALWAIGAAWRPSFPRASRSASRSPTRAGGGGGMAGGVITPRAGPGGPSAMRVDISTPP